jgi:hypothetical protein
MESFNQNVIKHKTGLLNLAAALAQIPQELPPTFAGNSRKLP